MAWQPPEETKVWSPPDETKIWSPPEETLPENLVHVKEPRELKKLKESGEKLTEEQERILWEEEDKKGLLQQIDEYLPQAAAGLEKAVADIGTGAAKLAWKGAIKPLLALPAITADPSQVKAGEKVYGTSYTPEEGKKIREDFINSWRSFAIGTATDIEEMVYTGIRGAAYGTSVTDKAFGVPKEERWRKYQLREGMREIQRAMVEANPDRAAALIGENDLLKALAAQVVKAQGGSPEEIAMAGQMYEELAKEAGLTAEEIDQQISAAGEFFSPVAIPGANKATEFIGKKTGKALDAATNKTLQGLKYVAGGIEKTSAGVEKGVEFAQEAAKKIGEYTVNDPDTWVKGTVNTAAIPIMAIAKPTTRTARVVKDVLRQVDVGGTAGRRGMLERAGRDAESSEFTRKLFGAEGRGGIARAKTADWMIRQSNAIIQPAVNGAALNTLMGLPDIETAEQGGYMFGYGWGVGGLAGARIPQRAQTLIDPTLTASERISQLIIPDPAQIRRDEDADLARFRAQITPEFRQTLTSLSSIDKRKSALDAHIADLEKQKARTINPADSAFIETQIVGAKNQRAALDKATPETQKEFDRQVELAFLDNLDQAQAVVAASGLQNFRLVVLQDADADTFIRNLYGDKLREAERVIDNMGFGDAVALQQATELVNRYRAEVDQAKNSRGFAIQEDKVDEKNPQGVPIHLRKVNQQGATVVVNADLIKHLTNRGFNFRDVVSHEIQHGLNGFKEVQELQQPLRNFLFDQKIRNLDGTYETVPSGYYSDADLDRYAIEYAKKMSPADGGASFLASFGGNVGKLRTYIKEEIISELASTSGDYNNGLRASIDDQGRAIMDWLEVATRNGKLKVIKEGLRKAGVIFDNNGGVSETLNMKFTPEMLAMFREYQRGQRDLNQTLTYNRGEEVNEPDIPWIKVLDSRILQDKNKDIGIFETEVIVKATAPDGTVTEIVVPPNAQINPFLDVYTTQDGKLIDSDGNPVDVGSDDLFSSLPNNVKLTVDTRVARKADGTPIILSPVEMRRRITARTAMIKNAFDTAPEDDSGTKMQDIGSGQYRGALSKSQVEAVLNLPNNIVAPQIKRLIIFTNDILRRKDGTRMLFEYQPALLNGKYKALSPRIRDEIPIGFHFSKDGNFLVTTMSVSRMKDKADAWAAQKKMNLAPWNGDLGRFWDSVMVLLKNHAEGHVGETDLDPDPFIARRKKNKINDLFNVYTKDTKDANPERSTLPRRKGKDSLDVIVRSRRLDRITQFEESMQQKMPFNYELAKINYMPVNNALAGEQTPEQFMDNIGGTVTATKIRKAIAQDNVEKLELELRNANELRPFETLMIGGDAENPTIRVTSIFDPEFVPVMEDGESVVDYDAPTEAALQEYEAQKAKTQQPIQPEIKEENEVGAEQKQADLPETNRMASDIQYMPVPDQKTLAEMAAQLPEYEVSIEEGKDIDLFDVARIIISLPEGSTRSRIRDSIENSRYKKLGKNVIGYAELRAEHEDRPTAVSVDYTEIATPYRGQGYGQALYREIAKYAQKYGKKFIASHSVSPEASKARDRLFKEIAWDGGKWEGEGYSKLSRISPDIQYMPTSKPSQEYGLEEGQEAETRLTPRALYNLYWISTEPEPTNSYGKELQSEYLNKYKALYLDVFKDLVKKQIDKYIRRGRVDSFVTPDALAKANTGEALDRLMKGTYRSDMRRRNDLWNLVTGFIGDLENAKTRNDKLFYMDRLNNAIHNTQELLFSKFENSGSLQSAFDTISNAKDTRAYSRYVDKDLREATQFTGSGIASLPYVRYSIPKDPRTLMADFYLLTTSAGLGNLYSDPYTKGFVPLINEGEGVVRGKRYEAYIDNLNDAVEKLSNEAQQHMKDALLFSVSAELRHVYDNRQPADLDYLMNNPFMQKYKELLDAYNFLDSTQVPKYMETYVESIQPESRAARITKDSEKSYRISYAAVRKALEETGVSLSNFASIAETLYREGRWNPSYGGKNWGNIAEGLRNVVEAKTQDQKIKAIDDAYALQHNTGKALNKLRRYMRNGGYGWLDTMLDLKYQAHSPREFIPLSSMTAVKIATPAVADVGFKTKEVLREELKNEEFAAGDDALKKGYEVSPLNFVETLEYTINALPDNQEDVYQSIGVTARKYSGKDINKELMQWLKRKFSNNAGAQVLEKAIPYTRLLLAEKMRPKFEVPDDIRQVIENVKAEQQGNRQGSNEPEYGPPMSAKSQQSSYTPTILKQQNKINWKPFTLGDWQGFSGAEKFSDGGQPLIGTFKMKVYGKEEEALFIADAEGINVFYGRDSEDVVVGKSFKNQTEAINSIDEMISSGEIYTILDKNAGNNPKGYSIFEPASETATPQSAPTPKTATIAELPAKLLFLENYVLGTNKKAKGLNLFKDLIERIDQVSEIKKNTQTPFSKGDINKVVGVWEAINWQSNSNKLTSKEKDEIFAYAYDYVAKSANAEAMQKQNEQQNLLQLAKDIDKMAYLKGETPHNTYVDYGGLTFSAMKDGSAEIYAIDVTKDGKLVDQAAFNMKKSGSLESSVIKYLENTLEKYGNAPTAKKDTSKLTLQQHLEGWEVKFQDMIGKKAASVLSNIILNNKTNDLAVNATQTEHQMNNYFTYMDTEGTGFVFENYPGLKELVNDAINDLKNVANPSTVSPVLAAILANSVTSQGSKTDKGKPVKYHGLEFYSTIDKTTGTFDIWFKSPSGKAETEIFDTKDPDFDKKVDKWVKNQALEFGDSKTKTEQLPWSKWKTKWVAEFMNFTTESSSEAIADAIIDPQTGEVAKTAEAAAAKSGGAFWPELQTAVEEAIKEAIKEAPPASKPKQKPYSFSAETGYSSPSVADAFKQPWWEFLTPAQAKKLESAIIEYAVQGLSFLVLKKEMELSTYHSPQSVNKLEDIFYDFVDKLQESSSGSNLDKTQLPKSASEPQLSPDSPPSPETLLKTKNMIFDKNTGQFSLTKLNEFLTEGDGASLPDWAKAEVKDWAEKWMEWAKKAPALEVLKSTGNMDSDTDEANYYKTAFNKFNKWNWKQIVHEGESARVLIKELFNEENFKALKKVVQVGEKFLIPYSPGGDKVYILHGKNENIDGGAIFGILKKSKKQVKQNMVDWVSDFINYYDPEI
jgi:hypothetical protein